MVGYIEILCGVAAIVFAFYYYFISIYDFWKIRGVNGPKPIPIFGNTMDLMLARTSLGEIAAKFYNEYKNEQVVGIFSSRKPILVLRDPDLVKDVLIRDFTKFSDRGFFIAEKMDPLSPHLFNLESKRWRQLRPKLSPVFTSGKLKDMFPLILECAEKMEQYLEKEVAKGKPVECRELAAKYTTDVISSCAFGIETNALSDTESEFRRMGKKVFDINFWKYLELRFQRSLPRVYNLLGYIKSPSEITKFFTKVVADTMNYRIENNIVRPDFINTLLELKKHPDKLEDIKLTDTFLTAQAFVFFIAGFETSSTTIGNALYELALNPEVQEKLRHEIREHYDKNNGEWKYEHIKDMKYLNLVFLETLRKYSPGTVIIRKSECDYTFKNTKITIPKDTVVWIPTFGFHRDPDIYPDPDAFIPERFNEDAVAARNPMHYLPFGDGPRNCIGARFAVCQTKLGLIKILHHYRVDVCEKTMIPYVILPTVFILTPVNGIYLKITKVED